MILSADSSIGFTFNFTGSHLRCERIWYQYIHLLEQFISSLLAAVFGTVSVVPWGLYTIGRVHPGKIWDGSKICFSFVKCKKDNCEKGDGKREPAWFFHTRVFSGRSILGNVKMKFEDVEIDPLKTLSAHFPHGKSSYTPRLIHTPLLRLLFYIYYYKSNLYNICGFLKKDIKDSIIWKVNHSQFCCPEITTY